MREWHKYGNGEIQVIDLSVVAGSISTTASVHEKLSSQAVLDETLRDYIERKEKGLPRLHVMDAFTQSLGEYDGLYRKLAK